MESMLELWEGTVGVLSAQWFKIGNTPISASALVKLLVFVFIAVWVSRIVRAGLRRVLKMRAAPDASVYALDRLAHYLLLVVGLFLGLSAVGFDFSSFALVAGALGLGVGLGVQPLVANFFGGLILLIDRSLKVGDFVELESGLSGKVRKIQIRYTIVTTNDNVDVLVPNMEFITGRVVNWTLEDEAARIHVPFGVAYGTDKDLVKKAALEAAASVPDDFAYLQEHPVQVWFVGFGDSSLDFELVIWVPGTTVRRPSAAKAAYLWELHTALYKYDIEIPFPQRDLHVRSVFGKRNDSALELLPGRKI